MAELLKNHIAGEWIAGTGDGTTLTDPVTGEALVRVSSDGLDLRTAFDYARTSAGTALRGLTYAARAAQLAEVAKLLQARRDEDYVTSLAHSCTTESDSG